MNTPLISGIAAGVSVVVVVAVIIVVFVFMKRSKFIVLRITVAACFA